MDDLFSVSIRVDQAGAMHIDTRFNETLPVGAHAAVWVGTLDLAKQNGINRMAEQNAVKAAQSAQPNLSLVPEPESAPTAG